MANEPRIGFPCDILWTQPAKGNPRGATVFFLGFGPKIKQKVKDGDA
jgi:hypothetical protein